MTTTHHWHPDGTLTLILPIPDRRISPNAQRGQSRKAAIIKSRKVKAHRTRAMLITRSALAERQPAPRFAGYALAFFWPTAAYRDDDNADGSCKAYRDGIADALAIDDRHLKKLRLSTHTKVLSDPRVEISLLPRRKFVIGSDSPLPLKGFPPGKYRLRLRPQSFAKIYVQSEGGIRAFLLQADGGHWVPGPEIARNIRGHLSA